MCPRLIPRETMEILCTGSNSFCAQFTTACPASWYAVIFPVILSLQSLFLRSQFNFSRRLFNIPSLFLFGFSSRGNRRFVKHILQIRPRESHCPFRYRFPIHRFYKWFISGINSQDSFFVLQCPAYPPLPAGQIFPAAVKPDPASPPVGGRQYTHVFIGRKSVHLHQYLIQSLFAFVMSPHQPVSPLSADSVNFINKNYRRRIFFLAVANKSRTRALPTPTSISINSLPAIL